MESNVRLGERPFAMPLPFMAWLRRGFVWLIGMLTLLIGIAPGSALAGPTTTTLTSSLNPVYVGQTFTLTVTVSGTNPTGTIRLWEGSTSLNTLQLTSGNSVTSPLSFSTTGAHNVTAVYYGDANNATSTSTALPIVVNPKVVTTTTLAASPSPSYPGQAIALTATISGSSPTGAVTFQGPQFNLSANVSGGVATLNAPITAVGTHSLTASYSGDGVNAASTGTASQTVNVWPTTTQLSCPSNSAVAVSVNCTVSVTIPVAPSTYNIYSTVANIMENGTTVATGGLTGSSASGGNTIYTATIALPATSSPISVPGTHTLQAQYQGTGAVAASTSAALDLTVQKRTSTTTLSATPGTAGTGQLVTLTATVGGLTPSGTVTFLDGGTPIATGSITAGKATVDVAFTTTGSHSVTASYAGDVNNNGSASSALTETVVAATPTTTVLTVNPSSVVAGQPATLIAQVSGSSPTGTVVFSDGGVVLGSAQVSGGQAALATTFPAVGTHALVATYRGSTTNGASTSQTNNLTVNRQVSTTTINISPQVAYQDQSVTLSAAVQGAAVGGTVNFTDAGVALGSAPVLGGVAVLATNFTVVGVHPITATYAGDANNQVSSSNPLTVDVRVGQAPPGSLARSLFFEHDANGNRTKITQGLGVSGFNFATQTGYDSLNRAKEGIDPKLGRTRLAYDGQDSLLTVTDPRDLVTRYPRNGLGDATQLVSPDTGTATMTYDAAGNVLTRTDSRGAVGTFGYDALGRLSSASYTLSGRPNQTFTWAYDLPGVPNSIGRLGQITYPSGSATYTYSTQGELLSSSQTTDPTTGANTTPLTHVVSYEYSQGGQLSAITYPSGRRLVIAYANGLPSSLSLAADAGSAPVQLISDLKWTPLGAVKSWQWALTGGPQLRENVFDTAGRLVRYRLGNVSRDLGYDAADRITSYTHYDASTGAAQASLNQSFGYDENGRLTTITTATAGWTITYDANGNRTGVSLNGTPSVYTTETTSNRLTSTTNPARNFGYDSAGNTTSDSANYTATYDAAGRLQTLTKAGTTTTYSYNAQGQRVRKFSSTGASTTNIFVYDQSGQLLGEYNSTGTAIREYVWLGSTPIAMFTPPPSGSTPVVYYFHTDHLNTPRIATDTADNIRWRWMSEPFGATAPEDNPQSLGAITQNLRFPGQYFDQESGLSDNWHRTYDSTIGRYAQSDPIGLAGGINTFAYVDGNPVSRSDPTGQFWFVAPYFAWVAGGGTLVNSGAVVAGVGVAAIGVGAATGTLPGPTAAPAPMMTPNPDLQREIESSANYWQYKRACRYMEDINLERTVAQAAAGWDKPDVCEVAKRLRDRVKLCQALRKANTDKWHGGVDKKHDPQTHSDIENALKNAEDLVRRHCKPGCS